MSERIRFPVRPPSCHRDDHSALDRDAIQKGADGQFMGDRAFRRTHHLRDRAGPRSQGQGARSVLRRDTEVSALDRRRWLRKGYHF